MMTFKEQEEIFNLIGKSLEKKTECLVIGGSAMMYYGAKEATKDVDLVALTKESFLLLKKVIESIGFKKKERLLKIFPHYVEGGPKPVMLEGRDTRIDLFLNEVICFKITDMILQRIQEMHEYENLLIKVIAPEDIILLKCATDREKDRFDALELTKKFTIKWDVVLEESLLQTKLGQDIFPIFLYDFLVELKEDHHADIPKEAIRRVRKISELKMIEYIHKHRSKK